MIRASSISPSTTIVICGAKVTAGVSARGARVDVGTETEGANDIPVD
ncbi:MAG TPA: hypothetical protein VGC76_14490 [Pyrinomonadaceae bacterium]